MIGNTNCRFNALSSTIRCVVNPDGPCDGCISFEPVRSGDRRERLKKNTAQTFRFIGQHVFGQNDPILIVLVCVKYAIYFLGVGVLFYSRTDHLFEVVPVHIPKSLPAILILAVGTVGCLVLGLIFLVIAMKCFKPQECNGGIAPSPFFGLVQKGFEFLTIVLSYICFRACYFGFCLFFY